MISKLKPLVSAAAISAMALASQGCSRGDSHTQKLEDAGSALLSTADIAGAAVKGLLMNADCVLHDTTGQIYSTVGSSRACTNDKGDFSISLRKVPRYPLMLTIKARAGSTMKCDRPAGCGSVAFGNSMPVPDTFSMRAIAPTPSGRSLSMNVTPWSEIAVARALNSTNGVLNSSITDTMVKSASGEVAGLLNNLLGIEGQAGAFDPNFIATNPSDLTNPKNGDNSKGVMMTMLSAALLAYQNSSTDITKILSDLGDSFKTDGKFNVNDHASNIDSGDTHNLTSLLGKLSEIVSGLKTSLTSTQLSSLQSALANGTTTTTLDKFKSNVDSLKDAKDAVEDADNDPTAPTPVTPITSRVGAAKQYVAEVASILNAIEAANGTGTPIALYNVALSTSSDSVDYVMRALLRTAEAASQISALTAGEATDLGCSGSVSSTLSCDFGALTELTENRDSGPGTVTWNATSKTVSVSGINFDGVAVSLTMTRSSATISSTSRAQTFTATTLMANGGGVLVNAAGATYEMQQSASGKGSWSIYTSDLYDSEGSLTADEVSFSGILNISRATQDKADATDFNLSHVYFDGDFTATGIASLPVTISFDVDASTADESTMPEDESASDYYLVTDLRTTLSTPTTFTKYNLTTLAPESTDSTDTLVLELDGDRTAYQAGNLTSFRVRLLQSTMLAAGTGSFDFSTASGTKSLTFRNPNGTKIEFSANSSNETSGAITVYTDGKTTNEGTVSNAGTATFSDNTSVSIAAFIFNN